MNELSALSARHTKPGQATHPPADTRADRRSARLAAADRALVDACLRLKRAGVDPDDVSVAIAIARDCLAEARACSDQARQELTWAQRERLLAQAERLAARDPGTGPPPPVADQPGRHLCPSPDDARTAADLLAALRQYWIWSGRPSYRTMARRCGRRFAASTIHAAINSSRLPAWT